MIRTVFVSGILLILLITSAFAYLRYVYFFRDPKRVTPENKEVLYAPCDGLVVYVKKIKNGDVYSEKLGEKIHISEISGLTEKGQLKIKDGWLMGIYMSPLDVHFNYAPQEGIVKSVIYTPARVNYPMVDLWEYVKMTYLKKAVDNFARKFHLSNERNTIVLDVSGSEVILVEIADKFVNKIDCFVKPGEAVKAGQKISFIKRGSQVDVYVSAEHFKPLVKPGDRVTGAVTPVFKKII